MSERKSVTVALTARQKQQIRNATGKSIGTLKIQATSGGLKPMLTTRRFKGPVRGISLGRRGPVAKSISLGRRGPVAKSISLGRKGPVAKSISLGRRAPKPFEQ